MALRFSELRCKEVINVSDGARLGYVSDLELDISSGQIRALIVPAGAGIAGFFHGEKSAMAIPWQQIACIGDDVILVSAAPCRG